MNNWNGVHFYNILSNACDHMAISYQEQSLDIALYNPLHKYLYRYDHNLASFHIDVHI